MATIAIDANHASLQSGVGFAAGEVGQSFSFDGVDDWLLVANSPVLNFGPGQDFSLEAWIAPISSSTTFGILSIFDKRVVPDISHCLGYEFNLVDGKISMRISSSLSGLGVSSGGVGPDLRDGQFHHIAAAVQRNSATGGRLYVDGQLVGTFDPTSQAGICPPPSPCGSGATPVLACSRSSKARLTSLPFTVEP